MGHDHASRSRREFLKFLGLSGSLPLYRSPLMLLMESIVIGAHQKAYAQSMGVSPRRYLHILQQGAPPRWTFDLPLTPYSTSGFVANAHVGTAMNFASSGASVSYQTVSKGGLNLPSLWSYAVPAAAGGTRPMDPLLQNLLVLRGIVTGNPDHGASQAMQFFPIGAVQGLPGLVADQSTQPIAAVNLSLAQYQFISFKAKSAVTVPNGGNMLSSLLSPFQATASGTFLTNKNKLGSALDAAIQALNQATSNQVTGADAIASSTQAAKDLMSQGFGDLNSTWNSLVSKYRSLISRSLDPSRSLPGITDAAVVPDGTTKFQLNGTLPSSTRDLRTMITSSAYVDSLAEHFSMAEYILTNNLSSSIAIGPGSLGGLILNGSGTYLGSDEHTVGGVISTFLNTYMNIAYAACLLELIDQLKNKGIFNETVIVMGGEFGRNPNNDASGSDHGYLGSSSTIYSGAFNGPLVLGNIANNGDGTGTWGLGAPVPELGRPLSVSDWACTIAYLLRVPPPTTASTSLLVSAAAGGYTSLIGKATQV